jgi:hypothetical protein
MEKEKNINLIIFSEFEGEYQNGQKWNGVSYEYDNDDNLLFKVKYVNGEIEK